MTSDSKTIPQRAAIDDRHKWDLADIYPDDNAWEADFRRTQELIDQAAGFAGKLAESSATMYACLKTRDEMTMILSRLYQYAYLNKDLDNRVSKYQAMVERAANLSAQAGAAFAFVEPELLEIDEPKLRAMAAQFEKPDHYDFYIRELIRSKTHIRSQEVEEVLAMASMVTRAPDTIFGMLDDADIKYPSIKDTDGEEVEITKQRAMKLLESPDRQVRHDAFQSLYTPYREHLNTLGASLAGSVNGDVFEAKVRHYESCLHAALDGNNIPVDVYHQLIEATEKRADVLHRWIELRRKLLKVDKIGTWDMFCPLFPEQDYEVPYDDAVRQTIDATRALGGAYTQRLEEAFGKRWVDVYETPGKGSGAYNYATFTVHPFVLMNYNRTVDNMFTLAHEMGHALHSYLANSTQPYPKARYSIFVAEVASTLNEGLVLDYLLKRVEDDGQRLYLLNRAIDNTVGTFFNQVLYAHFELDIHREIEKGGALSPDVMSNMWAELTARYHGDAYEICDLIPLKWARIPHFYTAFYVYQYATSYAASQAILSKFLGGESGIIDKYLKMLSAGGSDYPIELLKICGVDMTTPYPVAATLDLFEQQVAEVERLTK